MEHHRLGLELADAAREAEGLIPSRVNGALHHARPLRPAPVRLHIRRPESHLDVRIAARGAGDQGAIRRLEGRGRLEEEVDGRIGVVAIQVVDGREEGGDAQPAEEDVGPGGHLQLGGNLDIELTLGVEFDGLSFGSGELARGATPTPAAATPHFPGCESRTRGRDL